MPEALIIDDDSLFRGMLKMLFQKLDFTVIECEDGEEGIRFLKKKKYDIVTLDLKMPRLGGDQVMQVMHKRNEDIPVIVISGYLTRDNIKSLSQLGVRSFLQKPFDTKLFINEVNKFYPLSLESN